MSQNQRYYNLILKEEMQENKTQRNKCFKCQNLFECSKFESEFILCKFKSYIV